MRERIAFARWVSEREDAEGLVRQWRQAPAGLKRPIEASSPAAWPKDGELAAVLAECLDA